MARTVAGKTFPCLDDGIAQRALMAGFKPSLNGPFGARRYKFVGEQPRLC